MLALQEGEESSVSGWLSPSFFVCCSTLEMKEKEKIIVNPFTRQILKLKYYTFSTLKQTMVRSGDRGGQKSSNYMKTALSCPNRLNWCVGKIYCLKSLPFSSLSFHTYMLDIITVIDSLRRDVWFSSCNCKLVFAMSWL